MTLKKQLLEARPYSFSEVFNLNMPTADLLPALGYEFCRRFFTFSDTQIVDVSSLEQEFKEVLPYTDLNNEQARRETIVSSIVKFVVRKIQCRLSYEYSLTSERFYGNVDYLLQKQRQLVVVEAKRDDLENGFNQLAAELIALDQGGYVDEEQTVLTGFVTTGTTWQIGLLGRQTRSIMLSLNTYRVPEDLTVLIPILIDSLTKEVAHD